MSHEIPTTTALVSRLQVFEPTRRPVSTEKSERNIKTKYGTAKITGRLGQSHADVLEAILFNIIDVSSVTDNSMTVIVDPYRVRKSAGGGKQFGGDQLDLITKELMSAVIDIRSTGVKAFGHIIDTVETIHSDQLSPLAKANIGHGIKTLWRVTIGKGYLDLLLFDHIGFIRNPEKIAKITHGISQAIVRLCKTHKHAPNGGWKLNGLIDAVGSSSIGQVGKDRRKEVRKDAQEMKDCGIELHGDRLMLCIKNS